MVNKLDIETLNRLRGIGGNAKPAEKKETEQKEVKSPEAKAKSAALENLLNNVPDNVVPESEKKYTAKDLDDFLENFMKNHHS